MIEIEAHWFALVAAVIATLIAGIAVQSNYQRGKHIIELEQELERHGLSNHGTPNDEDLATSE